MPSLFINERYFTSKNVSNCSRVLKSKENISKSKCNKSLKKKLKKYKLRKDGKEDPDVIDVSQTLKTALRIKSPNNQNIYPLEVCEENRSYNYLTKMVRMKKNVSVNESTSTNSQTSNVDSVDESISLTPKHNQDKKQTNAFKLLMDSRNKSIGGNSPGKDKCEEVYEAENMIEKKELKAKRILSLKRMAQAKGSLKNIEIEEYREENIKKKLKDRVRRFKDMIDDMEEKKVKKDKILSFHNKSKVNSDNPITPEITKNGSVISKETSVIQMFDLFKGINENKNNNMKKLTKEDEEFLNKLSPSIRKKENMLCYFQKVSSDISRIDDDSRSQGIEESVIKVKLKPKKKPKAKKSKNSTEKDIKSKEHPEDTNQEHQCNGFEFIDSMKKRKRNKNNESGTEITNNEINGAKDSDSRPKRSTKKPVKYADDYQLISSDEELHIFTPKKKRKDKSSHGDKFGPVMGLPDNSITNPDLKVNKRKDRDIKKKPINMDSEDAIPKKATKLAPIFVVKPQLDPAAIEAKQRFLQSGVPLQLKKTSVHQINISASDDFPTVVHIQNLAYASPPATCNISNMFHMNYVEDIQLKEEKEPFKKLLEVPILPHYRMPNFEKNVDKILQEIKQSYPRFPVYRTYHLLRGKSKGEFKDCVYPDFDNSVEILNSLVDVNHVEPDKLNWVDKYKPATEKQVIGNFESIKELRRWLVSWTENNAKCKKNKVESDSSDFYQSDTDSRETMKNVNNLLIITGKVGSGKTLSVYAVAAELAIKVIEVNASTKRTGKIILQDLQEATQSHKVNRGRNGTDCSQKSQEDKSKDLINTKKKCGRRKKVKLNSVTKAAIIKKGTTDLAINQDSIRTGMSLILIDDADIVFDQDDGFCYAISQLIQCSKRPVILVTSSLTCPHLQKFSCIGKIIKMQPFLPRMLGTWLDIMCLVDNNTCSPGLGAKVLDLFKGDIRKTINYLQFYVTSHKYLSNEDDSGLHHGEEVSKVLSDDENSCMSWAENEGWDEKNIIGVSNSSEICKYFMNKDSQLSHYMGTLNNFYVWWNLPYLLNYSLECYKRPIEKHDPNNKRQETKELNKIYAVLDSLSMTDCLGITNEEPNITSKPWHSFEKDSVIDSENYAAYDRHNDCVTEIKWELMVKSIALAQKDVEHQHKTEMKGPSMSLQRDRDRVVSRHKTLTSCLNPSTSLDRRALALDYWSLSRSICRTEKSKTDNNSKRNNRFCHYLKSLNIVCTNDYFDNLAGSLVFKN